MIPETFLRKDRTASQDCLWQGWATKGGLPAHWSRGEVLYSVSLLGYVNSTLADKTQNARLHFTLRQHQVLGMRETPTHRSGGEMQPKVDPSALVRDDAG